MRKSSLLYRWRGELGVLVGVGVLVYLFFWRRWQLFLPGRMEDLFDVAGVSVAVGGHLVRVWALSHIGTISRTTVLQAERLAKEGLYAVVRHPLYLGNWLIALGLFMVSRDGLLLAVGPLLVLAWYMRMSGEEEKYLRQRFGSEYEEYARAVPRFFPLKGLKGITFDFRQAAGFWVRTKEYQSLLGTAGFVLAREMIDMTTKARMG